MSLVFDPCCFRRFIWQLLLLKDRLENKPHGHHRGGFCSGSLAQESHPTSLA